MPRMGPVCPLSVRTRLPVGVSRDGGRIVAGRRVKRIAGGHGIDRLAMGRRWRRGPVQPVETRTDVRELSENHDGCREATQEASFSMDRPGPAERLPPTRRRSVPRRIVP